MGIPPPAAFALVLAPMLVLDVLAPVAEVIPEAGPWGVVAALVGMGLIAVGAGLVILAGLAVFLGSATLFLGVLAFGAWSGTRVVRAEEALLEAELGKE